MFKLIIFVFIFFSQSEVFAASSTARACGVEDRCPDGYYCSGAVGESKSGVCVANGINIVLCRGITYVKSDVVKYFFLFGAVFAGLYFFLGKFTFVTFAQIVVGIGIIYGATNLVIRVTGSSAGLCSQSQASACFQNTTGNKVYQNEFFVRNLDPNAKVFPEYLRTGSRGDECEGLGCVKAKCEQYTAVNTAPPGQPIKKECTKNGKTVNVGVLAIHATNIPFAVANCQEGFTVKCEAVKGSYMRDYFKCVSCVGETFFADAPNAWNIKDCKELVKKQIK